MAGKAWECVGAGSMKGAKWRRRERIGPRIDARRKEEGGWRRFSPGLVGKRGNGAVVQGLEEVGRREGGARRDEGVRRGERER